MKKIILTALVLLLVLATVGCASSARATATASTRLSEEGQLLVGTLKLEKTGLAVTASQAADLLPLWEALASLSNSDIASSVEVEAVVSQIQGAMTAEQLGSITAMNLTGSDLAAIAATPSTAASSSSSSTTGVSLAQAAAATGAGGPGGSAPAGGSAPSDLSGGTSADAVAGQISGTTTQSTSTQTASGQTSGISTQITAGTIDLVVALLQQKIG